MRACGLAPREVQRRILEALKREELVILRRVAAGAWSLQSREFVTREEEAQAEQEARAATARYDYDAYYAIVFEQSPSPDGIIGPIEPESWEVTVTIAIRDGHLVIELLAPKFPPESYSFAIATPEAVDKLLAAASPARASSAAVIQTVMPQLKTPELPPRQVTAIEWIMCEAQRLKRTNKIPAGINKTKFAQLLADNMREAAKTDHSIVLRPVRWKYILNHLQAWGLWPIFDIE